MFLDGLLQCIGSLPYECRRLLRGLPVNSFFACDGDRLKGVLVGLSVGETIEDPSFPSSYFVNGIKMRN